MERWMAVTAGEDGRAGHGLIAEPICAIHER